MLQIKVSKGLIMFVLKIVSSLSVVRGVLSYFMITEEDRAASTRKSYFVFNIYDQKS